MHPAIDILCTAFLNSITVQTMPVSIFNTGVPIITALSYSVHWCKRKCSHIWVKLRIFKKYQAIVGHDRILLSQHFLWHSTIYYIYIISEVSGLKDRRGFVSAFLTILQTYEIVSTFFLMNRRTKRKKISLYFCHL